MSSSLMHFNKNAWRYFRMLFLFIPVLSNAQWLQYPSPVNHSIEAKGYFETEDNNFVVTNCGTFTKPKGTNEWRLYNSLILKAYYVSRDTLMATHQYEWDGVSYGIFTLDLSQSTPDPEKISYDIDTYALFKSSSNWTRGSVTGGFAYLNEESRWNDNNSELPVDSVYNWYTGEYDDYWRVFSLNEFGGMIYAGTHRGLYKTSTVDSRWEQVPGIPEDTIRMLYVFNDTLFAATRNRAYYSPDGINWTNYFETDNLITALLIHDGVFFTALDNGGIRYSQDLVDWSALNNGLNDLRVRFIAVSEEGLVCGTETGGINYYREGQWTENNEGILYSSLSSFAVSPSGMYFNSDHQVWYAPEGYNYEEITPDVGENYFGSVSTLGDTVILTYKIDVSNPYLERDNFLIFSYDHGATWVSPENQPPYWGDDTYRLIIGKNGLYAYEDDKMFYTEDMGTTWQAMPVPAQYCNMFYSALEYDGTPYASACSNKQMLKWENNAWQLSADGLPDNRTITHLFACEGAIFAYIFSHAIYVSTNGGISWKKTNSDNLPTFDFMRREASYEKVAFITSPAGVFYTDNYGNRWNSLNEGMPARKTFSTAVYKDTLYVSTRRNGLWKLAIEGLHLSTSEINTIDNRLQLFPNPANDRITVKNIDPRGNYNLRIRDLNGRLLIQKNLAGEESLDVQRLVPGMYLVTVRSEGKTRTGKLIISR